MNYLITGKGKISPIILEFKGKEGYEVMSESELKDSNVTFTSNDKVYAPDETSVSVVLERMQDERKKKQIITLKDKYECRKALQAIYPDFYFKKVKLDELPNVELPAGRKFIVKPVKGFFGTAVREINSETDLKEVAQELKEEITKSIGYFSAEVFSEGEMIIEQFAEGEEYTVDMFYDENGEVVVTSMCHHPESKHKEYFHLLYYNSEEVYRKIFDKVVSVFQKLNEDFQATSLPIHAEFKLEGENLVPIEFNVPRFGGFFNGDLPYYAFGINPFAKFFESEGVNWDGVWDIHHGQYYGWVLCYNGKDVDLDTQIPDYEKLKRDLPEVLEFYKLDYKKNPVFGVAFVKTDSKEELEKILQIDLDDYFTTESLTNSRQ